MAKIIASKHPKLDALKAVAALPRDSRLQNWKM